MSKGKLRLSLSAAAAVLLATFVVFARRGYSRTTLLIMVSVSMSAGVTGINAAVLDGPSKWALWIFLGMAALSLIVWIASRVRSSRTLPIFYGGPISSTMRRRSPELYFSDRFANWALRQAILVTGICLAVIALQVVLSTSRDTELVPVGDGRDTVYWVFGGFLGAVWLHAAVTWYRVQVGFFGYNIGEAAELMSFMRRDLAAGGPPSGGGMRQYPGSVLSESDSQEMQQERAW